MGDIKNALDAAVNRSKGASLIIAQKNVGEAAIGVIKRIIGPRLPEGLREYVDNPFFDVIIANALVVGSAQYSGDKRLHYIANGALLSSIDKVVDAVGIQDLIASVLNEVAGKIPVNFDQKDE